MYTVVAKDMNYAIVHEGSYESCERFMATYTIYGEMYISRVITI